MKQPVKLVLFTGMLLLMTLTPAMTMAHTINYALEKAPVSNVVWFYMRLGVLHIIPYGTDHILFITSLCLLSNRIKTILWQATAFTVAHSVTLALSMKNILMAPGAIIEPIIALSILFVAVENVLYRQLKPSRILIVFLFGLIHGMGFASVLNETGLPRNKFYTAILSFNAGVEIGQATIIVLVFLLIVIPFGKKAWYTKFVVYPVSAVIAVIAAYWFIKRAFFAS
ncbi:MAG TPA: HupE/UreJ family protein [Puia sp.]|nr:HupE/UreJ family protein [Puia sp.]